MLARLSFVVGDAVAPRLDNTGNARARSDLDSILRVVEEEVLILRFEGAFCRSFCESVKGLHNFKYGRFLLPSRTS